MPSSASGRYYCPHWNRGTYSKVFPLTLVCSSSSIYVLITFLEYEWLGHFSDNWHVFFFLLANVPCTENQVSPWHLIHAQNSLWSHLLSLLPFLILLFPSPFCFHMPRSRVPILVMILPAPASTSGRKHLRLLFMGMIYFTLCDDLHM